MPASTVAKNKIVYIYEDKTNLVVGRAGDNGTAGTSSECEDPSASPKAASPCD